MIEQTDIDAVTGRYRVVIDHDDDVADPRDDWDGCTDVDYAMWADDCWEFVTVTVTKLCRCDDCSVWHESDRTASLGMVAMGRGDGWHTPISKIILEDVPELIDEIEGS